MGHYSQLTGLRWEDITEDDLLAILQADAEPSYAASLIHEPFAFTRHLLNTPDKANPPMYPRQPQHPQRAPSPGFASPTTASLSTTSPFGLSSPSSVDEPGMPSTHEHAFPYPPHVGDHGAQPGAAFFAYPPVPSPASSMSMPPPPQRPGKRARGQEETPGMEPPPAHRKMSVLSPRRAVRSLTFAQAARVHALQEAQGSGYETRKDFC